MKLFCLAACLAAIFFFDCRKDDKSRTSADVSSVPNKDKQSSVNQSASADNSLTGESANQVQDKSAMIRRKKEGDLEYEITVTNDKERVLVKYRLKNSGKKSYLIFNRGISPGCGAGKAFVAPAENGAIDIAQKFYPAPQDIECRCSKLRLNKVYQS